VKVVLVTYIDFV